MQTKVIKCQPTCLTFIVEASKTVHRRKGYRNWTLSRILILFNIISE
ncbi:MAG: hypothetical protein ACMUEL_03405 [Flavobacteriales bacterium Tduv]